VKIAALQRALPLRQCTYLSFMHTAYPTFEVYLV